MQRNVAHILADCQIGAAGRREQENDQSMSTMTKTTSTSDTGSPGDQLPADHALRDERTLNSPFMRACRGRRGAPTPVWFMRQAGRSLPEYRAIRRGTAMLESCLNPEMATEITLQPVRRHHVDAAILFSDIMVPLKLAGMDVRIEPGTGPVIDDPIRTPADVAELPDVGSADMSAIIETVRLLTAELNGTPLIGFCGGPYTVASYLVEGRPSASHSGIRAMMHTDLDSFTRLIDWVARLNEIFLTAQVLAGASAVQVFDSWVGELTEQEYRSWVMPTASRMLDAMRGFGTPRIHFGVRTAHLLPAMVEAGANVIGVGSDITLSAASQNVGASVPVQGNLDPGMLSAPMECIEQAVAEVLAQGQVAAGHIFNLGHGVPKQTDPGVLTHIVDLIHEAGV